MVSNEVWISSKTQKHLKQYIKTNQFKTHNIKRGIFTKFNSEKQNGMLTFSLIIYSHCTS